MNAQSNSKHSEVLLTIVSRQILLLLALLVLTSDTQAQQTITVSFDFRNGAQGWEAGFADYSPATDKNDIYQLRGEIRNLPPEVGPGTGFYLQGDNHSDDLFMFLKRRIIAAEGIVAGQPYQVRFDLAFASNAQSGCVGVGGSPGDGVTLKAGATPAEPLALLDRSPPFGLLRMNVEKANQVQGGLAASTTGSIANGVPCGSAPVSYVSIQRTHQHTSIVNANSRGELWLLVGTDSGFEALTALYFQRINVTLTPVSVPPAPALLIEQNTGRAVALESVTLLSEPFPVTSGRNLFSSDRRTRLTLFAYYLELKNGEDASAITVQAEDSQHRFFELPVEGVREVPKFDWISAVTVRLPDELAGVGDVHVKVSLRGVAGNQALVSIN
ncbi:MAG TPA: hypothetical protein VLL54_13665 [Pyrinomonadaceae bacterium]|nr:hypothetical protein [Pyrinomonadaceae bacterium]